MGRPAVINRPTMLLYPEAMQAVPIRRPGQTPPALRVELGTVIPADDPSCTRLKKPVVGLIEGYTPMRAEVYKCVNLAVQSQQKGFIFHARQTEFESAPLPQLCACADRAVRLDLEDVWFLAVVVGRGWQIRTP